MRETRAVSSSTSLGPAEIGLVLVTMATAFGFSRVFSEGSFLAPVCASALASHLVSLVCRRRGLGIAVSGLLSMAGAALFVSWWFAPGSTTLGIPRGATLRQLNADGEAAWLLFQEVVAPAPPENGFVIALVGGVWAAAFLADWAAFRLWSPVEALVPTGALFVFAGLLGADQHRAASAGIFLSAVLLFLLVHRVAREGATNSWIAGRQVAGNRRWMAVGGAVSLVAALFGVAAGPALPGGASPAYLTWQDSEGTGGGGSRVTLSPLVDIQSRIVDQADVLVFTVETDEPAYWRLTSLDTFDGEIWKSHGDFADVNENLPSSGLTLAPRLPTTSTYTIEALSQLWLPAAYEATRIEADAEIVYEPASGTLIVGNDHPSSDGFTYVVESALPRFEAEGLRNAPGEVPEDIADRYLDLPSGFSPEVSSLAHSLAAEGNGPYEQALLLQNYFREFTYDDQIESGHGIDSMEEFLEIRAGYCEQFAGTFAAMARSLGIPARVAVGFTPGDPDPINPRLYRVYGRHAHAWPEIYIDNFGWIPFEPTPSRGAPGAESWTNIREQQDTSGAATPVDTTIDTSVPDPVDTTIPADAAPTTPTTASQRDLDTDRAATEIDSASQGNGGMSTALWTVAVALVAAATYVALMISARRTRRRIPVHGEVDQRIRGELAWYRAIDDLAMVGLHVAPHETHDEFAARVQRVTELDPELLAILAGVAAEASYAPAEPRDDRIDAAVIAAEEVRVWVDGAVSYYERVTHLLDPRPLLIGRGSRLN